MQFNPMSDLHLNFHDLVLPGGHVLVLAGDVIEAGHLRIADNTGKDVFLADRYRRFFKEELPKYDHVIYVAGNHEHYHNAYQDTHSRILDELPHGVHFLENDSVEIDDVLFWGATFWTDCNRGDPVTAYTLENGMYDYRGIKHKDGVKIKTAYGGHYYTHKFTPQFSKNLHMQSKQQLSDFCKANPDRKIVVVTHHAPTELSLDPTYLHDYHMNGGYHSRLGDFILDNPNIKCWVHGHVHCLNNYEVGQCRVISNPRGYKGYEMSANYFNPAFFVEV